MKKHIGVLALQGGYAAHGQLLMRMGYAYREVRSLRQLDGLDGLILPGGESSAQLKLLMDIGLLQPIKERIRSGLPTLGTCAGLILLATEVLSAEDPISGLEGRNFSDAHHANPQGLGLLDITCRRNAYGRQLDSREGVSDHGERLLFIRAPRITRVGEAVEVLDRCVGEPVAVRQDHVFAATFHPELTDSVWLHQEAFR